MADYYAKDQFRAGLYRALIHKNDTEGYAMGQFTDAQIADREPGTTQVTEALIMGDSFISIGSPGQNRIEVQRLGGQKPTGLFDLGAAPFEAFNMAFTDSSPSLEFVSNGSLVNTTESSDVVWGGENPSPDRLNKVGAIVTIGSQTYDRDTDSVTQEYIHYFYPSLTMARSDAELAVIQSSTTNPYVSAYRVSPAASAQLQTGRLVSALNIGMTSSYRVSARSPHKNYGLVTAIMADAATTFTLPRLPYLATATNNGGNYIFENGARIAVTSVNTTTGVVTLSSAATEGDVIVMWYPLADQSEDDRPGLSAGALALSKSGGKRAWRTRPLPKTA